jgi:malate dehydrogenase (oxaloacetate-decarboxylating)
VPELDESIAVELTGFDLLANPLLNKGTAFTESERDQFHLHGLLPPHVGTLEEQVTRRLRMLRAQESDFERYALLRDLQDMNETLFYALVTRNIEETMPLVYTPTVGEGCQRFSEIWRRSRGLFLSYPNKKRIREILANPQFDKVRVIVVSDGERILGLGDQGAGGMGIPIGKLSLYTACAGIRPEHTLPVLLDVGTNNTDRLNDPLYIGWRHDRVRGEEYDDFVEAFVTAVSERWPHVLLQWEDFAQANAHRLLERYRNRLCTFNDDIQGTAAVAAAALLAAMNVTGTKLADQRVVLVGAGSAGCGIGNLLLKAMVDAGVSEADAKRNFYAVDKHGLLVDGMNDIHAPQRPFVQSRRRLSEWKLHDPSRVDLLDVVTNARPTALIAVSGQPGALTEPIVREMAAHAERPIIFPLSNPTSRAEATPAQLLAWTDGRAIVSTGSPFPPVNWQNELRAIDQTNNSYIFPGFGLGVLASHARRVTDKMFMASAKALAEMSPARHSKSGRLLPPVTELRHVAVAVAKAVAKQAAAEGVAEVYDDETLDACIRALVWEPVYRPYRRKRLSFQSASLRDDD